MRAQGIAVAALLVAACAPGSSDDGVPVVFAAASLSSAFSELDTPATFSFDGSSGLVDQIAGGAPADVFASADGATMERAVAEGLIDGEPVMFATNHLVLIVPGGNPAGVIGFDASLDGVKLVVCAPEVPCGAATAKLADAHSLALRPVSEESKVTDVLGKVASGEADAGLVYATDAAHSNSVESIAIPGADDDPNTYWAAVVKGSAHPHEARAFIDNLTGEWATLLEAEGFGPPR